jgi:hypothetical protein
MSGEGKQAFTKIKGFQEIRNTKLPCRCLADIQLPFFTPFWKPQEGRAGEGKGSQETPGSSGCGSGHWRSPFPIMELRSEEPGSPTVQAPDKGRVTAILHRSAPSCPRCLESQRHKDAPTRVVAVGSHSHTNSFTARGHKPTGTQT